MITLEQINDHRRTAPPLNPDTGKDWIIAERSAAIQADLDAIAALNAPTPEELAAQAAAQLQAVQDNAKVETYLIGLKATDPARFDVERKLPFVDQLAKANAKASA
jgi:hypothetical protein